MEAFYAQKEVGIQGQDVDPSIVSSGWVRREIEETLYVLPVFHFPVMLDTKLLFPSPHRSLEKDTGIATWVTFGHKKKGWELTSYYSPELFKQ